MIDGVFLIGMDGATWSVMDPLISAGQMPHIAALREEASWGVLRSVKPYVSPPAWTSLVTGKRPGGHAILDFITKEPGQYSMKLSRGGDRGAAALWSLLSVHGMHCCVANVTMSFPPDPIDGIMISGLDCPWRDKIATHPENLSEELLKAIPEYSVMPPRVPLRRRRERLEVLLELTRMRTKAGIWLAQRETWDFFMIQFSATDVAQHFYWADWDLDHPGRARQKPLLPEALPKVYTELDRAVGQLLKHASPDTLIMLVSDHGFGPMHSLLLLNPWLAGKGYLEPRESSLLSSLAKKVRHKLSHSGDLVKTDWAPRVEWTDTQVYSAGTCGNLFFNLKGREPSGTVEPSERAALIEKIKEELGSIRQGEEGAPVVVSALEGERLFEGPYSGLAPDLWLETSPGVHAIGSLQNVPYAPRGGTRGGWFTEKHPWTGNHHPDGILLMKGPGIVGNQKLSHALLVDILPTVLRWLDLPIPQDIDGYCLENAFQDDFLAARPLRLDEPVRVNSAKKLAESERERIEMAERLRDLGYLG